MAEFDTGKPMGYKSGQTRGRRRRLVVMGMARRRYGYVGRTFLAGAIIAALAISGCAGTASAPGTGNAGQPAAPAKQAAAPAAQPAASAQQPAAQPTASPAAAPPATSAPAAQPAKPAAPDKPAEKPAAAPSKDPSRVVHGTSQLSSSYGVYSAALVKLLNTKVPGVNVTLTENGSVVNNLKRVKSAETDFAMGDHTVQSLAYQGILKGFDGAVTDSRLLWVFDVNANSYVVSEASGVKSVSDLDGKPFSPGGQGTSAEVMTLDIFEFLGIKSQFRRGSMSETVEGFKDRRAVGFVKASPLNTADALIMEAATSQPVRILNWPKDLVDKVQSKFPYYKTSTIAAGVYKDAEWNRQAITTWGSPVAVFASTNLSEELAYQFTKVALADKTDQVAAFPALKSGDIGKMTLELGLVPLHKGAVKAFREAGLEVPKGLVPAEAQ
ncbi:MAG: TAXI family TRAP transporter solute-binding subunit [Chloroflexi bacterium]|nr:TAXI family TRAP transporter solute-binding subunit [Chloroflexota bacterium]